MRPLVLGFVGGIVGTFGAMAAFGAFVALWDRLEDLDRRMSREASER